MATTTWNPSDKTANCTLTGSNLIATGAAAGTNLVRAVDKQITGKFYWEVTYTVNTVSSTGAAVTSPSFNFSTSNFTTAGLGSCCLAHVGTVYVDGVAFLGGFGTIANGTVVCIAVDCAARLIWFRLGAAGLWNIAASANPATGTGGIFLASLGGGIPIYPAAQIAASGDQLTANFGGAAFTGTVPSGFTSGFTSGVTTSTNALVTQAALEAWVAPVPVAQVTQAALEAWYANGIAQVTQVALEEWAAANPPAQVTQIAMEMWASVALYTPPPFVPPPPPPGPGKGHGHGGGGKGGGQPKISLGAPALQGEVERFEAFKPRHRYRPHGIFPPAITVLTLSGSAVTSAAISANVRYAAALSASASTSDAILSGRILAALLAEGSTSSATISALLRASGTLAEGALTADALHATAKMLAALAASSVTSDTPYHGVTAPGMLSESAVTSAAITAFLAAKGTLAEGSATNAVVAGFRTLVAALAESGASSAALTALLSHGAALAEGSASHDALSATAKVLATLAEAAAAGDGPAATAILRAALADGAGTLDADTYVATTHPLRRTAKLIGEHATPDLIGEWREPRSSG